MGVGRYEAILKNKAVEKQHVGQLLRSPSSLFPCPTSCCQESRVTPFLCHRLPCLMEGLESAASGTWLCVQHGSKRFSPVGGLSRESTCQILMRLSRLFIQHRSLLWIQISGCIQLNINLSASPKSPLVIVSASVFIYSFSCAFSLPLLEEQRKVSRERIFFFNRQNGTNQRNLSFEC